VIPRWKACSAFANRPYGNTAKLNSALDGLHRGDCHFVSVEGDYELREHLVKRRTNTVTFALLRDPLLHLVSSWRHDIGKAKFATVEAKYATNGTVSNPQSLLGHASSLRAELGVENVLGFPSNLQTNRLGAGNVDVAMRRLLSIEFGLTDYFHASICMLLYVLSRDAEFERECRCGHSPLSGERNLEQAQAATALLNVSLGRLVDAYTHAADDRVLYAYAHELFVARVRVVERESGRKLLCKPTRS
jgi:hypothetical protein